MFSSCPALKACPGLVRLSLGGEVGPVYILGLFSQCQVLEAEGRSGKPRGLDSDFEFELCAWCRRPRTHSFPAPSGLVPECKESFPEERKMAVHRNCNGAG